MAAVGMGLGLRDFAPVLRQPAAFALGALGQIVLLPLTAFGVAYLAGLDPLYAVGLVLIAACPGGATSNAMSQLARGDVALSVSLTATSSLLSFVSVPLWIGWAGHVFADRSLDLQLPLASTAAGLFTATALPLGLGMALRSWRPQQAERVRRPLLVATTGVVFLLLIGLGAAISGDDVARLVRGAAPPVAALFGAMLLASLAIGRVLGLPARQHRTLVIELAVQNFNLALVVALEFLGERTLLGPALMQLPLMLGVLALTLLHARATREREA
jgi:BASS family bile acid:Na+ symporter